MTDSHSNQITVGDLCAEFCHAIGVTHAFGVISIHNMPILDGFHTRGSIRFISARGEAGACNMADAHARVQGNVGVVVTSTGTGAGNAAGALIEALTAGTPMLHLTGQIESAYIDRELGFIHESHEQLALLKAAGKASFRIRNADTALSTLIQAVQLALTAPCGPVSVEIPIDIQKATLARPLYPKGLAAITPAPIAPQPDLIVQLAEMLRHKKRPLLWLGGGARNASKAAAKLISLGFGVVTSVQGRGIVPETHPQTLGAFNLQKAAEALYAICDAMLVVGSRLRSNETFAYKLQLPATRYRIDANAQASGRAYSDELFIQGDAQLSLNALADALEGKLNIDSNWHADIGAARAAAEAQVDSGLAAYLTLKNELNALAQRHAAKGQPLNWVRDITLSNTMWGNRSLYLDHARQGVHALGGGIGQGLQMGVGASLGAAMGATHGVRPEQIYPVRPEPVEGSQAAQVNSNPKTLVLCGDGGFMLNVGELACAAQERANILVILMNDACYGVIKNIQDDIYGSRHCYVDLHTPDFGQLCASMKVPHFKLAQPAQTASVLAQALDITGPVVLEVDMKAWGAFAVKFAGPPKK